MKASKSKFDLASTDFSFLSQMEAGLTPKKENILDVFRISYLRKRTLILGSVWCDSFTVGPTPSSPHLTVDLTSPPDSQVLHQPAVLRPEPERRQLRPKHLPHAVHLWRRRNSRRLERFCAERASGQETESSRIHGVRGCRLPFGPRRPKRYFHHQA